MPIYCTTTINGTAYEVSTETLVETVIWEAEVVAISQVTSDLKYEYGGHLKPVYGTIEFLPTLFADHWPPPETISQLIEIGNNDQDKHLLCQSECNLKYFDRSCVIYSAIGLGKTVTDEDTNFTTPESSLRDVFEWGCGLLGYTLNDDNAPLADTIIVQHINESKRLILDLLSEAAAGFLYYFYIIEDELFLCDLTVATGSVTIDEFEFLPNKYYGGEAISLLKDKDDVSVDGSNPSGKEKSAEVWKDAEADVQTALSNIVDYLEQRKFTIELKDYDVSVDIGNEVTLFDESCIGDVTGIFTVTKKNLNFSSSADKLIVEGRGTTT